MEVTVVVLIGALLCVWGLSTALSWVVKVFGRVVARRREIRPQTRYFVG